MCAIMGAVSFRSDEEWDEKAGGGPKPLVRPNEAPPVKQARLVRLLEGVPAVMATVRQRQATAGCARFPFLAFLSHSHAFLVSGLFRCTTLVLPHEVPGVLP